jgi:hypothetical protein
MLSRQEDLLPGLGSGILCCSSSNIFFPLIAALAHFRVLEQAAVLRLGTILPEVDYNRPHRGYQHPDACKDQNAQEDHCRGHKQIVSATAPARPAIHWFQHPRRR